MADFSQALPIPHPRQRPTQAEVLTSQKEIHRLDSTISDLKRQISELQARLAPLQRERDNLASYISPFRRLPVDIISEIIHHCRE
ncbi:hypothetical protein CPB86DRAFT_714686 [Serendipita vermifera]|nr:hypothetical protein CPB86DRAFT_714686 [Serendipita vermifera]